MLKKAVTCPSVFAPGAPGVSNGDCWDCLVSPCFIIDLPVHTRTPDVTDPIAPLTGSREALTGRYGLRFWSVASREALAPSGSASRLRRFEPPILAALFRAGMHLCRQLQI